MTKAVLRKKGVRWTPALIKRLRGKRSLSEFATLLDAPKNTVWRWESGRTRPDAPHARRLRELAEAERFCEDWELVGSIALVNDLDGADAEIAALFRASIGRTAHHLRE